MEASGLLSGLAPLQPEGARGVSPGADPGPSVLSRSSESGRGWRVPLALRVAPGVPGCRRQRSVERVGQPCAHGPSRARASSVLPLGVLSPGDSSQATRPSAGSVTSITVSPAKSRGHEQRARSQQRRDTPLQLQPHSALLGDRQSPKVSARIELRFNQ